MGITAAERQPDAQATLDGFSAQWLAQPELEADHPLAQSLDSAAWALVGTLCIAAAWLMLESTHTITIPLPMSALTRAPDALPLQIEPAQLTISGGEGCLEWLAGQLEGARR